MFLRRLAVLGLVLTAFSLAIGVRLAYLQLALGDHLRKLATAPARRTLIDSLRGSIVSTDGVVLAEDRAAHELAVRYPYLTPLDEAWVKRRAARRRMSEMALRAEIAGLWADMADMTGMAPEELHEKSEAIKKRVERMKERVNANRAEADLPPCRIREEREYHPLARIESKRALHAIARIESDPDRYAGILEVTKQARRYYPRGRLAGHIVGYMGGIPRGDSEREKAARDRWLERYPKDDLHAYLVTDQVGVDGVEARYESRLRGRRGRKVELLKAREETFRPRITRPQRGQDIWLTIHAGLQARLERLLERPEDMPPEWVDPLVLSKANLTGQRRGAIVVLDAGNGAVLAAVSNPGFDPGIMVDPDRSRLVELLNDPQARELAPLRNRTIQMRIPSGSIFKLITAVAALHTPDCRVTASTPIFCNGYMTTPQAPFKCWIWAKAHTGHGNKTLVEAIEESCNCYFYTCALRLGLFRLAVWADRFGFGHRTGIDIPNEHAGHLPLPRASTARTTRSAAMNLCIGQGRLLVTPMQVARAMAAIANGGRLVTPHVVPGARAPAPPIKGVQPHLLAVVRRAMERVCSGKHGTARLAFNKLAMPAAGKTGTAQAGGGREDHAWFAGYAPADAPKVAIAVAIEHGGHGGDTAAPFAACALAYLRQIGCFAPDYPPKPAKSTEDGVASR